MATDTENAEQSKYLALLSLSALGIVFGDIGTSPLYAIRECFSGEHALAITDLNVYGVLSLIFWSMILVIVIKYMIIVLRADNKGEGGILALMALVYNKTTNKSSPYLSQAVLILGLFGSALLYGDGVITPAISVLSAIEGLKVATPIFEPYILPITTVILVLLFSFQKFGTGKIGIFFGPIMLLWFGSLGVLGAINVWRAPTILYSINPQYAFDFFILNKAHGLIVLGSIFLVVTGGEAVYADMGHFGKKPIRLAWFTVAMPALLLNYFGQGALMMFQPETAENPFFHMMPKALLYPAVILSAMATVIASQAVISGVFSLTRQAIMLGYFPRVRILHTSYKEIGQIYIPLLNWMMLFATLFLVYFFKSSSSLAAAYGIAISITMVITTLLVFELAMKKWKLPLTLTLPLFLIFLSIDISFFAANSIKFFQGGWFPIVLGIGIFFIMATWEKGREILKLRLHKHLKPLVPFLESLDKSEFSQAKGTAIYMINESYYTPPAFIHNLEHNQVLHERVIFMNIETTENPYITNKDRLEIVNLPGKTCLIKVFYGFMQSPDMTNILELAKPLLEFPIDIEKTTFFLSHESLRATPLPGMAIWREKLFAFLSRNQLQATEHFKIPRDRVVELGMQINL
ncbi:MAG: potassium transporter Kup [Halobacteriovoraceae bacterium]|nr:potassium transporter Kup [Halobacteriovoraceae bacterium]MCB9095335.1 potassium transporter Kup [Halobacteriovoraceae bacterium]